MEMLEIRSGDEANVAEIPNNASAASTTLERVGFGAYGAISKIVNTGDRAITGLFMEF